MTISETRKSSLIAQFGDTNHCVKETSWLDAIKGDLIGEINLFADDMTFLLGNKGYCEPLSEGETGGNETGGIPEGATGYHINTAGISGSVYVNGVYEGNTNTDIEKAAGTYQVTIKASGYNDATKLITVTGGQVYTVSVTMTPESETETEPGGEIEGGHPIIVYTNVKDWPPKIKTGETNWFGFEHRNDGTADWIGYIGVKLTDRNGNVFRYVGDPTMPSKITPGQTKMLWAKTPVPDTLTDGNITIELLRTTL